MKNYFFEHEFKPVKKISLPNLTLDDLEKLTRQDLLQMIPQAGRINYTQFVFAVAFATARLTWHHERSLREFWYYPFKALLYKFHDYAEIKRRKLDKDYSWYLGKLVKSGHLTYKDIGVVDTITKRKFYEQIEQGNCWSNIILFMEKDTAFPHLAPLKDLLNITLVSGGGYTNVSFIEVLAENIINNLQIDKPLKVYAVSDYDTDGFYIPEEFTEKLELLGLQVDTYERLGLDPSMYTPQEIESQKFVVPEPEKKRPKKWLRVHGLDGPVGKVYGLELDAISAKPGGGQRIREIVLEGLLKHLKEEDRLDEIKKPFWDEVEDQYECYPIEEEFKKAHESVGTPDVDSMKAFIEKDEFDELEEERELSFVLDITEPESELIEIIKELDEVEEDVEAKKALATEHLREEIRKLEEQIELIESKIDVHTNVETRPLELERVVSAEESTEIAGEYDEDIEELTKTLEQSRALYIGQMVLWVTEEKDERYISKTNTTEELGLGLLPGVHLQMCKEGKTLTDLKNLTSKQDKTNVYEHIKSDIEDKKKDIFVDFEKVKVNAVDSDMNKDWHKKWLKKRLV